MKFFKLVNNEIVLDRDEVLLYEEFNVILKRNKPIEGDSEGRKKLFNYREFKYIYFMSDTNSFPNRMGYNKSMAHEYSVKHSKLPNGYMPDKEVIAAINLYKNHDTTPMKETAKELRKTLNLNSRVIATLRTQLEEALRVSNDKSNKEGSKPLLSAMNELIAMSNKLPDTFRTLSSIEEIVKEEDNKKSKVRGGNDVKSSMLPDNSIG